MRQTHTKSAYAFPGKLVGLSPNDKVVPGYQKEDHQPACKPRAAFRGSPCGPEDCSSRAESWWQLEAEAGDPVAQTLRAMRASTQEARSERFWVLRDLLLLRSLG